MARCKIAAALTSAVLMLTAGQGEPGGDASTPRDNVVVSRALGKCHLANLFLHTTANADGLAQPVDVRQVPGMPLMFDATLDYNMPGFTVEATAVPKGSCEVGRMSTSAYMVDPGSSLVVQLFAQPLVSQNDLAPQTYSVNVSRLSGTETQLHSLKVGGAYLVPAPSASNLQATRTYRVNLNLEEDFVRIEFQKLDNGQVVAMSAGLESVVTSPARRLSFEDGISSSAGDVPSIGEAQREISTLMTTLDAGFERRVDLSVKSADGSRVEKYFLSVRRPACPQEQRFFDGDTKLCTDTCNEGFYGSTVTGRCARCLDPNCAVCEAGDACTLCLDGFELQTGGRPLASGTSKCRPRGTGSSMNALREVEDGVLSYEKKHKVLVTGASAAFLVAICACCAFLHFTSDGIRRSKRYFGDDDEDEMSQFGYHAESYRG